MSSQFQQRIEHLKKTVPIRSVLDHFNVQCMGHGNIVQVRCPFHGYDKHASAKIYASNTMYCFVCQKSWDVLGFVQDKLTIDFKSAIKYIEQNFNVPVLKAEDYISTYKDYSFLDRNIFVTKTDEAFEKDFERVHNVLIKNRDSLSFEQYVKRFNDYDNLFAEFKIGDTANLQSKLADLIKGI